MKLLILSVVLCSAVLLEAALPSLLQFGSPFPAGGVTSVKKGVKAPDQNGIQQCSTKYVAKFRE